MLQIIYKDIETQFTENRNGF